MMTIRGMHIISMHVFVARQLLQQRIIPRVTAPRSPCSFLCGCLQWQRKTVTLQETTIRRVTLPAKRGHAGSHGSLQQQQHQQARGQQQQQCYQEDTITMRRMRHLPPSQARAFAAAATGARNSSSTPQGNITTGQTPTQRVPFAYNDRNRCHSTIVRL